MTETQKSGSAAPYVYGAEFPAESFDLAGESITIGKRERPFIRGAIETAVAAFASAERYMYI